MTDIKKENKEAIVQRDGPACNCIIVAGVMRVARLIKGLFVKEDKKSVDCQRCKVEDEI
ncbi:MAG: hypothetical protein ACOX1F_00450 [Erysipelotrichaceae bacterium]